MVQAISLGGHRWMALAGGLSVSLALVACSSAASPLATSHASMNMGSESTERTYGEAVEGACVDASLENNTTVIVTFYEAGEYEITCRPHRIMQTSVTVE
jgi:hypothetical protein